MACLCLTSCSVSCIQSRTHPVTDKQEICNAEQFVSLDLKEGGEYVVKDVVDLKGGNAKLPANVTITFKKGGAIVNGTLTGNRTRVKSKYENVLGVNLKGTWQVSRISDLAFNREVLSDEEVINNLNAIQSDDYKNEVLISRDYMVTIPQSGGAGLIMSSNSILELNATLTVVPNDFKGYYIVQISHKNNVKIRGGCIVGDVGKHSYIEGSTSEWGMGVGLDESQNVELEDIYVTKCCGDGIFINGGYEPAICVYDHACKNVLIKNVICDDNRRQGLSIIHVDGLTIVNSEFTNTGKTEYTGPGSGIDFEPDVTKGRNMSIRNVTINGCRVFGNKGKFQQSGYNAFFDGSTSSFENINIKDTYYGGMCHIPGDMSFDHCEFMAVTVRNSEMPVHASFTNCTIANGEGVCIVIQKPTIQYKEYERNRDYSVVFDNCSITMNENHYDEIYNGMFFYKGNNDIYDGGMLIKGCTITLPTKLNPNMRLFRRPIMGNVTIEQSTINAFGRPLDLAGATYLDCILNCEYLLLNTVRHGKDVMRNCKVNTTSDDYILNLGNYGFSVDGYEIENCRFTNKKAAFFSEDNNTRMKSKPIVRGNKFHNSSIIIE